MISERDIIEEEYKGFPLDHIKKRVFDQMDRKQFLNQQLKDVLRERNFERTGMYDWIFKFPKRMEDPERWILIILDNDDSVKVNINDEYVFTQTPKDLLNCLCFKFHGYGNAR